MSDHGAGKLHAMVNLNRWLANEGHLTFVEGQGAYRRSSLINRVATAYKRYLPVSWRAWIRRSLPGSFKSAKEKMESQLFASAIAWQKTRVYSLGACGNIFINLKGREPAGTVEAGSEYEALRDEVAARLAELRSPQGKPLVRQVLRREEVYHGRYLDLAPDLVVTWHDYGYWGRARYDQITTELFETDFSWEFGTLPLSGTHRPDGILIACGGDVIPGQQIEGARLVDLMPSIMSYLQLPVPRTLDGEVLADLFRAGAVEIRYADADEDALEQEEFSFSASEEDRIKQHLENLGYL
jgi:predicted AlkP superfamily phosphohydrolase/phosphomutase